MENKLLLYIILVLSWYPVIQAFISVNQDIDEKYAIYEAIENDHSMKALSAEELKIKDVGRKSIKIDTLVGPRTVIVKVNDEEIIHLHNATIAINDPKVYPMHRGVHVVVVHPVTAKILFKAQFFTWQPRGADGLIEAINSFQQNRIVILLGAAEWSVFIPEAGDKVLKKQLGAILAEETCVGEMWGYIGSLGGRVFAEGVTTIRVFNPYTKSSILQLSALIPLQAEDVIWNQNISESRKLLCENYEGFGSFCDKTNPPELIPQNPIRLNFNQKIPIVIVTATKNYKAAKMLQQIWSVPGGLDTPILLSVDGVPDSARDLANLVADAGVEVMYHNNKATPGTRWRINEHIKFTLINSFIHYPDIENIIILEDDLLISPDFIKFFHQIADVTAGDDSVFTVNAFNYNQLNPITTDPTRLVRVRIFPDYGWMINRKRAAELIMHWPNIEYPVDWDWYLLYFLVENRTSIIPEVSRTFHNGHGGVHTNGWEQVYNFDRRPLNGNSNVTLNVTSIREPEYNQHMHWMIKHAIPYEVKQHPCNDVIVPKYENKTYVIYYYGYTHDDSDALNNYYILMACLGGFATGNFENYWGLYNIGYYGNTLFLVSCPFSKEFCPYINRTPDYKVYNATPEAYKIAYNHRAFILNKDIPTRKHYRTTPEDFAEEVTLFNYEIMESQFPFPPPTQ